MEVEAGTQQCVQTGDHPSVKRTHSSVQRDVHIQPIDQYLERSCLHVYVSDLLRLLSKDKTVNTTATACLYFCAVAKGQHVTGREFAYVSLTLWNRQAFLHAAHNLFEDVIRHADALTLQDMHSLLLLLCPDVPVRVARSAFKAATPLLSAGNAGGAVTRPAGHVLKLPFCKLWHSLEVTFLYEHFLLELRHLAFEGKSHLVKTAADIESTIQPACQIVARSGWPCIPEAVLQEVMQQAVEADDASAGLHFDALVRGLCSSTSMQTHLQDVRRQALLKQQDARATLDIALETLANPKASTENLSIISRSSKKQVLFPSLLNIIDFSVENQQANCVGKVS